MKILLLIMCMALSSCASVKVNGEKCIAVGVCTKISYWSKKDHPNGVTVKYGDLEFTSKSSVSKDSVVEQAVANGVSDIFKQVKIK